MTSQLTVWAFAITAILWPAPPVPGGLQSEEELASPRLRIEWAEFKKLYDAKKIAVVDIRGADAFRNGHIPGARSVPLDEVEGAAKTLKALGTPVVTYCACPAEHTSARAAFVLQKHGIEARALVGGYYKWLDVEGKAERGVEARGQRRGSPIGGFRLMAEGRPLLRIK